MRKKLISGIFFVFLFSLLPSYFLCSYFFESIYTNTAIIYLSVSISLLVVIIAIIKIASDCVKENEIVMFHSIQEYKKSAELEIQRNIDNCQKTIRQIESNAKKTLSEANKKLELYYQKESDFQNLLEEKSQKFPWLVHLFEEYSKVKGLSVSNALKNKKRPAIKASEEVARINKEKIHYLKQTKSLQYQLNFYESLFPWLEDFKEIPPMEAWRHVSQTTSSNEYDVVKDWLSPEEYNSLPSHEKWQRALDNYCNRKNKTNWHVGIEYERYIGYLLEQKGYNVIYEGALKGLEDLGRDIIAKQDDKTYIIQCKRWAKTKEIHEKHIMQLFGSVIMFNKENNSNAQGIFISSTGLSEMAKYFAENLKILVLENFDYCDYPMIKCNTSIDGEKIYHLPFDQQYDRVSISKNKNCFYAETVLEAEMLGYRHAYRWKGIHGELT